MQSEEAEPSSAAPTPSPAHYPSARHLDFSVTPAPAAREMTTPASVIMTPSSGWQNYSPLAAVGSAVFEQPYDVPENFSMVAPGVYRSGFPKKKHFPFLSERLRLKSIIFLAPEVTRTQPSPSSGYTVASPSWLPMTPSLPPSPSQDYPDSSIALMQSNSIQLLQFGVDGNKEPFVEINTEVMQAAVRACLDVRNHPVLIHCNKGKHRTGCLVGCMRKTMRWSITSIFDEYRRFAGTKARRADQEFIELFETRRALIAVTRETRPLWLEL